MRHLNRIGSATLVCVTLLGFTTARADDCPGGEYDAIACERDEDCDRGRLCDTRERLECPEGTDLSCQEGESDEACTDRIRSLEESVCSLVAEQRCVGVWAASCSDDQRCGDGFYCEPRGEGPGLCTLADSSCSSDAECPDCWTCDKGSSQCLAPIRAAPTDAQPGAATPAAKGDESAPRAANTTESPDSAHGGCTLLATGNEGPPAGCIALSLCVVGLGLCRRRLPRTKGPRKSNAAA